MDGRMRLPRLPPEEDEPPSRGCPFGLLRSPAALPLRPGQRSPVIRWESGKWGRLAVLGL